MSASTATSRHLVCPHCGAVNRVPDSRPAEAAVCGACKQRLFQGKPADVDEAAFERHVANDDIPVLVDIWAPWCGPCRAMAPAYARAATLLEPGMRLLKLNADTAPAVTARLGVRGIPTLALFKNGRVVGQTAGAMGADAIVAWARSQAAAKAAR
ncbi:MAG TPA: thioredoxin TrxC [Acetobacteraceae bacterium]